MRRNLFATLFFMFVLTRNYSKIGLFAYLKYRSMWWSET